MSLTLLSEKLDKLNEKEKLIRLTYDVRGNNKHQHRYINDLKQDFKEDLELRYGNKPYGLGWNQDSEIETERDVENLADDADEPIPEDEDDIEKENGDIMVSALSPNSNFRPVSGKVSSFAQNRPFSASTIRPMTASSAGGHGNNQFMFQNRPISAISQVKKHFNATGGQEMSEFGMRSPQSMQHTMMSQDDMARMQASHMTQDSATKLKASESIFWKNTKKFDVAQSTKQFYTKQLIFDVPHADPKLINSTDLAFLKEGKIHNVLENSKLKAPKNHKFEDIAKSKPSSKKARNFTTGGFEDGDSKAEAKSMFNQSLSYIHSLRADTKGGSTTMLLSEENGNKVRKHHQRPVTAHPMMSSAGPAAAVNTKKPLETVKEHAESSRTYFSSLSDLRKKAFFLKLHSLEPAPLAHPSLSKEVKLIEWDCFKDLPSQPDFQSLHLLIVDLNSFDHVRYELDFANNGRVQAKDKEDLREVLDVYRDFLNATRTNIASLIVYYEATNNCMLEVFSRVLVYEKQEHEYDLIVWRNIYRFLLHKIILANAPIYPDCKTYQDFTRMIKDIIDDKRDYVSPIASQIQQTKDRPIVVERNGHVYNFDFHSYIMECSSYYAQSLQVTQHSPEALSKFSRKESKPTIENQRARPYSAVDPKNKFSAFANKTFQRAQPDSTLKDSMTLDPSVFVTPQKPSTPFNTQSSARNNGNRDRLAATLGHLVQGGSQPTLSFKQPSYPRSPQASIPRDSRFSQETLDFTVQGGRMDIYPDMWAASNTKSQWKGSNGMSMMFAPEYKKFSSSAMQTPKGFEAMFQPDPNGITVKHNVNAMKKHTNVVIQRRPYSAQKKPIQPHNVGGGNMPITMFLSGTKSNSRSKF